MMRILFPLIIVASGFVNLLFADTEPNSLLRGLMTEKKERVLYGDVSEPGEYPYFVLVKPGCGGSMIAPRVVLTAANCQVDKLIGAQVGIALPPYRYDLSPNNFGYLKDVKYIQVTDAISHPNYDPSTSNNYNFALMLLETAYYSYRKVHLVLNQDPNIPTEKEVLDIIGMGYKKEGSNFYLNDVQVTAMSNEQCKNDPSFPANTITDEMLCAGYYSGGYDTLGGDSGFPLIKIDGNKHIQVGFVSFQPDNAAFPVVFSRVSKEINWMKSVICNDWKVQSSLCDGDTPLHPLPQHPYGDDDDFHAPLPHESVSTSSINDPNNKDEKEKDHVCFFFNFVPVFCDWLH